MRDPWNKYRCQAAQAAWTLGQLEANGGKWQHSVAAYQAGLGLVTTDAQRDAFERGWRAVIEPMWHELAA